MFTKFIHLPQYRSLISRVHDAYLEAGADVLLTSSYQATICGLMKYVSNVNIVMYNTYCRLSFICD